MGDNPIVAVIATPINRGKQSHHRMLAYPSLLGLLKKKCPDIIGSGGVLNCRARL